MFILRGFQETHILVLRGRQQTTFAPKWAKFQLRCGNDARWDRWRILAEDLLPVPPSLETRTKRGFPHFHSDYGDGTRFGRKSQPR